MDNSIIIVFLGCILFGSSVFYWNTKVTSTLWLKTLTAWLGVLAFSSAGFILGIEVIKVLRIQ